MKQENFVLIISSPSGAGKTSIAKKICSDDKTFVNSVSVTTRIKRSTEMEGQDYFFVSKDEFKKMDSQNMFLECAEVFDHFYGSPKQHVTQQLSDGYNVLFDIDWQGAETIKDKLGDLVVSIFILPPSLEELERRLNIRQSNSKEDLNKRILGAPLEISKAHLYDYILVNDNFEKTIEDVFIIIRSETLKRQKHKNLIDNLVTKP